MHSTQLIVIAIGTLLGYAALFFYIRKALKRALNRSYQRGVDNGRTFQIWKVETLNLDLHQAAITHQTEIAKLNETISSFQVRLGAPVTISDHQLLEEVAITLDLALKTWRPLKGSQPVQDRTSAQILNLKSLSNRILAQLEPVPVKSLEDAA